MERILIINGVFIDIDDKTVIGIDSKSYDITNPAQRLNSTSNSFSVPLSENVAKILGFAHNLFSNSINQYRQFSIDYSFGGVMIINQGKAYYNGCEYDKDGSVRFNFIVTSKLNIWDELKDIKYKEFIVEYLAWMQSAQGEPSAEFPMYRTFQQMIDYYSNPSRPVHLVDYAGVLFNELDSTGSAYIETASTKYINYFESKLISGGHFVTTVRNIFKFIEHKFGINFNTDPEPSDVHNIFLDQYARNMVIPFRELGFDSVATSQTYSGVVKYFDGYYNPFNVNIPNPCTITTVFVEGLPGPAFKIEMYIYGIGFYTLLDEGLNTLNIQRESSTDISFRLSWHPGSYGEVNISLTAISTANINSNTWQLSLNNTVAKKDDAENYADLTLYDIVSSYMTIFNCIKDESYEDRNSVKLYRFDSISSLPSIFYKGIFASVSKADPFFDGIKQINKIRYDTVFETGDEMTAGKTITSENKSLDKIGDYITIKGYVPALTATRLLDLSYGSDGGALKQPCFMVHTSEQRSNTVKFKKNVSEFVEGTTNLYVTASYSLDGEYSLLAQVVNRPCVVTAKFYINPWQYIKNRFFARYLIPELGGEYIQLSISGYNPTKTSEPVECTFIKIPN